MMKHIDMVDVLVFGGLCLIGVGVYMRFGIAISLMVTGILLFGIGIVGVTLKGK